MDARIQKEYEYLKATKKLCYRNNPKSLFRKYNPLITRLLRHELFVDYLNDGIAKNRQINSRTVKILPNGRMDLLGIDKGNIYHQTIVSPRLIFAPKLYPALAYLHVAAPFLSNIEEGELFFLGQLGLLEHGNNDKIFREVANWFPHFATTTTARPDASVETTTVDGYAGRNNGGTETLAAIRAGAGNDASDNSANLSLYFQASTTTDQFEFLYRVLCTVDFTGVDDAEIKDSVTVTITGNGKSNGLGSPDFHIVGSNPASNTAVVNGDYANTLAVSFGSLTYANFPATGATAVITLDANGLAAISLSVVSELAARNGWDLNNSFGGVWGASLASNIPSKSRDSGATDSWLFTLTHHTAGAGRSFARVRD